MTDHNDSHARRCNGPRRRANHERINWTKRDSGPIPARSAQVLRFNVALDGGDMQEAKRLLDEMRAD